MASKCPVHQIGYAMGFMAFAVLAYKTHGTKGLLALSVQQKLLLILSVCVAVLLAGSALNTSVRFVRSSLSE